MYVGVWVCGCVGVWVCGGGGGGGITGQFGVPGLQGRLGALGLSSICFGVVCLKRKIDPPLQFAFLVYPARAAAALGSPALAPFVDRDIAHADIYFEVFESVTVTVHGYADTLKVVVHTSALTLTRLVV